MKLHQATILTAAAMCGCSLTSSDGIATGSLFVDYQVTRHGDVMTAEATFHVGDGNTGTYVRLDDGDEILCNDTPLAMQSSLANQVWYQSDLAVATAPFAFELRRGTEVFDTQVDAPPTAMVMSAPAPATTVSAQQPLAVSWTPKPGSTAGSIDISLDVSAGSCPTSIVAVQQPDTGSATIDGAKLAPQDGNSCTADLVVSRSSALTLSAPFEGGSLVTAATASAAITIAP